MLGNSLEYKNFRTLGQKLSFHTPVSLQFWNVTFFGFVFKNGSRLMKDVNINCSRKLSIIWYVCIISKIRWNATPPPTVRQSLIKKPYTHYR